MKVGDLVKSRRPVSRVGLVLRNLKYDRYMVLFFDDSGQYNMDKRLLEVISEG